MSPKRRPAKQQKLPATPIAERQRQLEEQTRRIREEKARCEALIARAPEIKKECERRQREELVKARSQKVPALGGGRAAIHDPRYTERHQTATKRGPRLRSERAQGRITFFLLLLALLGVLAWAYATFSGQ